MMLFSSAEIKQRTGEQAVSLIKPNMIVGIGTGSTAAPFIHALGERVREGLKIIAVPTSEASKKIAMAAGITLAELNDVDNIDITIDGADEIDPQLQLIKGGGGALLQEKIVAAASRQLIIVADHTKLVKQLGRFPLPVEVVPYGWKQVQRNITRQYNISVNLRLKEGNTFITDHGHYILDCYFNQIDNAANLNEALHNIPGVIETGLFIGLANSALIGYPDGGVISHESIAGSRESS
jgi:ribose 5-phosphate isomerase A